MKTMAEKNGFCLVPAPPEIEIVRFGCPKFERIVWKSLDVFENVFEIFFRYQYTETHRQWNRRRTATTELLYSLTKGESNALLQTQAQPNQARPSISSTVPMWADVLVTQLGAYIRREWLCACAHRRGSASRSAG